MVIHSSIIQIIDFFYHNSGTFWSQRLGSIRLGSFVTAPPFMDGQASTFHDLCDWKPYTITIIRRSPFVFGGYTDVAWSEKILS